MGFEGDDPKEEDRETKKANPRVSWREKDIYWIADSVFGGGRGRERDDEEVPGNEDLAGRYAGEWRCRKMKGLRGRGEEHR